MILSARAIRGNFYSKSGLFRKKLSQAGQAMLLSIVLLAIVLSAVLYFVKAGLAIQQKTQLQQTADSLAYSAALIQARALNFHAYVNRTQVAHQIAMAHTVTLASWASFADQQAQQAMKNNPPTWVILPYFPLHGIGYMNAPRAYGLHRQYSQSGSGRLARIYIELDRTVHQVLRRSQFIVDQSLIQNRERLIQTLLQKEYASDLLPQVAWLEDSWLGTTVRQRGNVSNAIGVATKAVAQKYTFLQPRNQIVNSLMPLEKRCPWMKHQLRRRGLTVLGDDGSWASADTLSWHAVRSNKTIGCYYREYPMGYNSTQTAAHALEDQLEYSENPPADFSQEDFWRWAQNNTSWNILGGSSNPLANSFAMLQPTKWGGQGIPSTVQLDTRRAPSIYVTLLLQQSANRPKNQELHALTEFEQAPVPTNALSRAQTYYVNPETDASEGANLFMAYWQARLVSIPEHLQHTAMEYQFTRR